MRINAKWNKIYYLVLWHTHKEDVQFAHRLPPSETSISSLRWCEVSSFIGISNLAVVSGPMACQCCGWMPLTSHSKLLLPRDPGARTCLPGPALCATPAGLACGGAVSVLCASWMVTQVHLSLLLHTVPLLFAIFVLRYLSSDRYMPKTGKNDF